MTGRCLTQVGVSVVVAAALLAGCGSGHSTGPPTSASGTTSVPTTIPDTTATSTTVLPTTTTVPVATTTTPSSTTTSLPTGWTEPGLLSQLLMVGASYADPGASAQVIREGAGGLVFFGQPAAGSGPTLKSQLGALDRVASVPPLMATDEEGGQIARLSNLVGPLPWPRQIAADWTPAEVTKNLTSVGVAMRAVGMNMDLAPVLDTASSSDTIDEENLRSFSEVGSVAASYGLAFWRGLSAAGIIGVVKHFPGLGHANGDTDLGPATDPPLAQMAGDDLVPFRQAISAGVRVVMMSNVTEPDWGAAPASVNPNAYAYLRGLGFTGVILTDSLDAGAISKTGADGARAAVEAIESGADMAMITTPSDYPAAIAGLEAAVSSGRLSMAQVVRSVDRIVAVKDSILPTSEAIVPPR